MANKSDIHTREMQVTALSATGDDRVFVTLSELDTPRTGTTPVANNNGTGGLTYIVEKGEAPKLGDTQIVTVRAK